jgi:hypothetical protein
VALLAVLAVAVVGVFVFLPRWMASRPRPVAVDPVTDDWEQTVTDIHQRLRQLQNERDALRHLPCSSFSICWSGPTGIH